MLLALDYDGTYTRDPKAFDAFIKTFSDAGHGIVLATMRFPAPNLESVEVLALAAKHQGRITQVIFTSRRAKAPFLSRLGVRPDIWIDDNPEWILRNSY